MPAHDIITAVPLAFAPDGAIDERGTRQILEYVGDSGVQGALVLGTTGEFPALSIEERTTVTRWARDVLHDQRLIVHVGAASHYEIVQLIEGARAAGVREIAVLTPYYLPTPDDEVYEFFRAVTAEARGLDVYAYIFRDRTGVPVGTHLMRRIAELPGIVGLKVSGESLDLISSFRQELPDDFVIYTGLDGDFARAGAAGADGVISGVASAFAKPFVEMREALEKNDDVRVGRVQGDVDEVVSAIEGSPTRMRAVHRLAGRPVGGRRMPIPEPDAETLAQLKRMLPRFH